MIKRWFKRFRFLERKRINHKIVATAFQRFSVGNRSNPDRNRILVNSFSANIYARVNGISCRGRYPQL